MLHRVVVVSLFFSALLLRCGLAPGSRRAPRGAWSRRGPCLGSSFAAFVALFSVLAVYLHRRPWLSGVLWGVGVCVEDQHPFPWAFWGACSLGIGEALFLCLWVCLWLSWRHMGWRQTGCFCITTVAYVLSQAQEPPYGVDGAVFRGGVVCTLHGVPLKGAEVVAAVYRPGAPCD